MMKTSVTKQEEAGDRRKQVAEKVIQIQTAHATKNLLWYCIGLSIILLLLLFMPNIFNNQRSLLSSLTSTSRFPTERTIIKYPDHNNGEIVQDGNVDGVVDAENKDQ